jgi:hypothetical protein
MRHCCQFALAVDEGQRFVPPGLHMVEPPRRYVERITKAAWTRHRGGQCVHNLSAEGGSG